MVGRAHATRESNIFPKEAWCKGGPNGLPSIDEMPVGPASEGLKKRL